MPVTPDAFDLGAIFDGYDIEAHEPRRRYPPYQLVRKLDGWVEVETATHAARFHRRGGPVKYTPKDPPPEFKELVKYVRSSL